MSELKRRFTSVHSGLTYRQDLPFRWAFKKWMGGISKFKIKVNENETAMKSF